LFLGIDSCPAGWYVVHMEAEGGPIIGRVYPHFSDILADAHPEAVLAVDIPIGLQVRGSRPCDELARAILAPKRSSSVFPAPLLPVLGATSHQEASAIRRSIDGKGMSIQAFAITRKVQEVDVALEQHAVSSQRVYEVHPEVCFAKLNHGQPMAFAKKKAAGRAERLVVLTQLFGEAPSRLVAQRSRREVGADDVLDALVALWSAVRISRREHESLPAMPDNDPRGRRMAIFY
jgi:predicted RNase H-like nuclease